jgi:hypothetical protein
MLCCPFYAFRFTSGWSPICSYMARACCSTARCCNIKPRHALHQGPSIFPERTSLRSPLHLGVPIMRLTAGVALGVLATHASAQSCPSIHIFGARETTVSPGYGSAGALVQQVQSAYPGATAEAITYPACGGQSSCGGVQYGDSARQGTAAVASAVNSFNQRCPNTQIVLIGYSQVRWSSSPLLVIENDRRDGRRD